MSDPYTIVLWCADAARFASMVGAHLLTEGILAANAGRIDDDIPIAVGVANASRWPIFSRTVAARGIILARSPHVVTRERYDYLLTFVDTAQLDTSRSPRADLSVVRADELVDALEAAPAVSAMSKADILAVFDSVARKPGNEDAHHQRTTTDSGVGFDVHEIADCCQRLVRALAG
jgi:hypothetical protein